MRRRTRDASRRSGLAGGGSRPQGRARTHAEPVTWDAEDRSARGRSGWCWVESVVTLGAADPLAAH